MKKLSYRILGFAITSLVFLATVSSASACIFGHYQPQVPKSLQK